MQNLKILLLTLLLSNLASCVDAAPRDTTQHESTTGIPKHQQIINSMTGLSVEDFIAGWGAPTKTFTIAGKEYIAYVFTSTITQPGRRYLDHYAGTFRQEDGNSYRVTDCTFTFEVRRGIIVGGNAVNGRTGGCDRHSE